MELIFLEVGNLKAEWSTLASGEDLMVNGIMTGASV